MSRNTDLRLKTQDSMLKTVVYSLVSGVLSLIIVFFIPSLALSQSSIMHIEAMGSIAIYENTADADMLAMEDAFKKAVTKAVEALVPEEELDKLVFILEDKIYNNTARYILNYRIISKEMMEDENPVTEGGVPVYSVYIEANIAVELLTKDLITAGIIQEGEVRKIAITMLNLRNYKVFEFFRSNILKARGVKRVYYISFARDKIGLVVETSLEVQALKQEIMAIDVKEWKIEASIVSGIFISDRIEVRFFPLKGQVSQ
ncbi:MAG: hypothetical protein HZB54_04710 [Deltaproteobacteria bacterium]|nr:hypothetical protein [Deltaproteobacteria bacterium]